MRNTQESFFKIKTLCLFLLIILSLAGCGVISDGEYTASVTLTGGSGKAYIESPCRVTVENGKATATLVWSSSNYDFMMVGGVKYLPTNQDGPSTFVVPVELGKDMKIQADTTAMSTPHLIDYVIRLELVSDDKESADNEENAGKTESGIIAASLDAPVINGLEYISTDRNQYATGYAIHRYSGGYTVISIDNGRNYLIAPADADKDISFDGFLLKEPIDKIYVAASGALCHFGSVGAIDQIALVGSEKDDIYVSDVKEAMDKGRILFGGKYSSPDYEQILSLDIDIAIENTMILHSPKVQEKLEQLGIPVFIDRSSYESEPLGRCEWIKVYGELTGHRQEADKAFESQEKTYKEALGNAVSGKKVAVFSINTNHQIVVKRKGDYFARMIEDAGGTYVAPDTDDSNGTSSMTISREAFYDISQDADILIYNAVIEEAPAGVEELVSKDSMLAEFKAVEDGQIFYMDKSIYQFSDEIGTITYNLHQIISGEQEETEFIHKLR